MPASCTDGTQLHGHALTYKPCGITQSLVKIELQQQVLSHLSWDTLERYRWLH